MVDETLEAPDLAELELKVKQAEHLLAHLSPESQV
jgi:hypothetical protein